MLVLIDESGDPGFKLTRGSTPRFVVVMVIFQDYQEAERAGKAIGETRERLRVKPEFKFSKCHDNIRDAFFQAVAPYNFTVRALVVTKELIYSRTLREEKDHFYNYFVKMLLHHDNDVLEGARIKIDGSGDREFKQELERYLKQQLSAGKIKSFKFAHSHSDNLIQLADMAAGAIARSYREVDRKNARKWRAMLESKIDDVWEFGKR
jgi:hypothetical protein